MEETSSIHANHIKIKILNSSKTRRTESLGDPEVNPTFLSQCSQIYMPLRSARAIVRTRSVSFHTNADSARKCRTQRNVVSVQSNHNKPHTRSIAAGCQQARGKQSLFRTSHECKWRNGSNPPTNSRLLLFGIDW